LLDPLTAKRPNFLWYVDRQRRRGRAERYRVAGDRVARRGKRKAASGDAGAECDGARGAAERGDVGGVGGVVPRRPRRAVVSGPAQIRRIPRAGAADGRQFARG